MAVPKTVARHHSTASQRRSLRFQLCSCYVLKLCRSAAACATRSQTAPHQAQAPPRRNGRPACPMSSTRSDPPARQPHAPRLSANARPDLGLHQRRICPTVPSTTPARPCGICPNRAGATECPDQPSRVIGRCRPSRQHSSEPRRSGCPPTDPAAFVRPRLRPSRRHLSEELRRRPSGNNLGSIRRPASSSDAANIHPHAPSAVTGHPNGICPNRAGGAGQPDRPVRSRARAQRLGRRTARRRPPPSRRDLPPLPVSRLGPG